MPSTVYTAAEIDAMQAAISAAIADHAARIAAIELRLDGTPNPPPDPPPPPPPPPPPAGDMDLGEVTVEPGSLFEFDPNASQTIRVRSLHVKPGGTLRMRPANASVKHTLIVKDDADGGSILIEGDCDIAGEFKTPYVRLTSAALAGQTTLALEEDPEGWQVGDRLLLPDTRQLREGERWGNYVPQWERATIAAIDGATVTLAQPLQFDHLGRDEFQPHAGNLTRNVVIKSENASGNRGWLKVTGGGNVTIWNAQLSGLGRSQDMNDERFPVGRVDHTGMFDLDGCSVFCPLDPMPFIWGVANVRSTDGLIRNNVIHNWKGAGVALRDSEDVEVIGNFVCGIRGDHNVTWLDGQDASGFWSNDYRNCWAGNIAASVHNAFQGLVSGMGFNINRPAAGLWSRDPLEMFEDNEAYGCATAASFWYLGTDGINVNAIGQSVVKKLTAWNCWSEAFWAYPIHNVLFDGITMRAGGESDATVFGSGDYLASKVTLRNVDAKGVISFAGGFMQNPDFIEFLDSVIDCRGPLFVIANQGTPGMQFASKWPREVRIVNVQTTAAIKVLMQWKEYGAGMDYVVSDIITVDGERVYYPEQNPEAIVPQTTFDGGQVSNRGCPEAGLRNDQALERHGVCNAGAIAPAGAKFGV